MAELTIKKVGNHWYMDVPHEIGPDISLDEKVEKVLNWLAFKFNTSDLTFNIEEVVYADTSKDIICFYEEDITRYFITDDEFDLRFEINEHMFTINSNMYFYITEALNLNFHINLYNIKLKEW